MGGIEKGSRRIALEKKQMKQSGQFFCLFYVRCCIEFNNAVVFLVFRDSWLFIVPVSSSSLPTLLLFLQFVVYIQTPYSKSRMGKQA